jgi:hypothetical protein
VNRSAAVAAKTAKKIFNISGTAISPRSPAAATTLKKTQNITAAQISGTSVAGKAATTTSLGEGPRASITADSCITRKCAVINGQGAFPNVDCSGGTQSAATTGRAITPLGDEILDVYIIYGEVSSS